MNKRITLTFSALAAVLLFTASTAVLNDTGQVFATGSPFDGTTCAQCHSGGTTIPTVTVTASPAFGVGNTFSPSATYTISATVSGSYNRFGFDMEILDSNSPSSPLDAGTIGPILSGNCQKFVFAGNPTNITHTSPSGSAGSATFSFEWTAPASGNVFIYCAGLGVNFNSATSGDRVKTFSVSLTPDGTGISEQNGSGLRFSVFPNPASERMHLAFELRERAGVSVKLFNLSGECVGELLHETFAPGAHGAEIRLPAGLPKGAYLVKLIINGKETTQKLLVL